MASYLSGLTSRVAVGGIVDGLFSASFTAFFGGMALNGLYKTNIVFGRGVDFCLKGIGFNTSDKDTWAHKIANAVPKRAQWVFSTDGKYTETHEVEKDFPKYDVKGKAVMDKGKPVMEKKMVPEYDVSTKELLISGLALSLTALFAFELKNAMWRETNPLLNMVLAKISPFQMVLGKSWMADGINATYDAVASRVRG